MAINSLQQLSKGFRLGEWLVKPEDGSLTSSQNSIRLQPMQMELLVFLCSRSGQVVGKQEILQVIWRGRFISDDTVKACFYQLRKALGDISRKPRFIETLPKRGFRMLLEPVPLEEGRGLPPFSSAELYRKGKELLAGSPNGAALKQARLYFERAIECDPDHAESAAALAGTYIQLIAIGLGRGPELLPRSKALAKRALETAPKLASAHVALGVTQLLYDWEIAAAEKSFRLAISLGDGDSAPHRWYAKLLSFTGRHVEAIAAGRRALQMDPLSLLVRRELVELLFAARLFEESVTEAQHLLRMTGEAPDVQLGLAWIYFVAGDEEKAFNAVCAGCRALCTAAGVLEAVEASFAEGGMRDVLREWVHLMEEQAAIGQRTLDLLFLYSLLDQRDRAFEVLDLLVQESHPALLLLPASPLFDSLRSDARYRLLLSRLKRD